jgi:ATP phosphoribosyltransferase regulatory subunit
VANGGRYDDIGRVFGRARPATGFSTDLKALLALLEPASAARRGIFVTSDVAEAAWDEIQRLRERGERVVVGLPGQAGGPDCDRELCGGPLAWQIHLIDQATGT